ncbi:uncharacterized protein TM35_000121090 [Trypanosoma theileri]|uniref:FHA domain-containing protein n=1 Tax=Trypanosoma theileri TaxID=67003 RepID=A0A1X0NXA5_9TRYP|nr:uncharacterized protein TM35_000121090 [Trypanosoma theileri]ORC89334.1 hypothetical protein TM35_000121090 [Trypanosoma theileri]
MKGSTLLRKKLQNNTDSLIELGTCSVKKVLRPPHLFDVHHELGSREFTMYAGNICNARVLIHCSVSNRTLRPLKGGSGSYINKKELPHRVRCQNKTLETSPIEFSAFISVPFSGITIEASCSSFLGLLIVDGMVIHNGCLTESLVPRDGRSIREMLYQGPLLNQRGLSEIAINLRSCTNPLDPFRQEHAFFFDGHVRSWSSRFMRFGHTPVHTTRPEFSDTLCQFIGCFNIDDELAYFVEQFAHVVQAREKEMWSRVLKTVLGGKSFVFPSP